MRSMFCAVEGLSGDMDPSLVDGETLAAQI
jgi:hypothetical protein